LGNLGSLADLLGNEPFFNEWRQNTRATFSPEMYPKLLSSKHFLVGLINQEFYFSGFEFSPTMGLERLLLTGSPADILTKLSNSLRYSYLDRELLF